MLDVASLDVLWVIACAAGGYLSGSIPFGLALGYLFGLGDIRTIGSGNIGATNALRTGNKAMAALTLLGDVLKGTLPVALALAYLGPVYAAIAGVAAFLGHIFPVWLRFKGGKGVATYLGVLLGIAPIGVVVFAIVWLSTAYLTRYSSLAALAATLLVPIAYVFLGYPAAALLTAILTVLVYVRHHANIRRLFAGSEPKIGAKKA